MPTRDQRVVDTTGAADGQRSVACWTTINASSTTCGSSRHEGSIAIDAIDAASLSDYARIVGRLLAKDMPAPAVHR